MTEVEALRQEVEDLRNHIFNGLDFMEAWLRHYGSTDQLSSETRQWCAVQITRAAERITA